MKTAVADQGRPHPHEESTLERQVFSIPAGRSSTIGSAPLVLEQSDLVNQVEVERLSAAGIMLFAAVVAMILGAVLHGLNSPTGPRANPGPSYAAQYSPYGNQTTALCVK